MSNELRIILFVICVLVLLYVVSKIRKSKMNIVDSIFWIVVTILLLLLAIFPAITYALAALVGISTPLNFLLLLFICILLIKVFLMSVKISQMEHRIARLAQKVAYDEFENQAAQNAGGKQDEGKSEADAQN